MCGDLLRSKDKKVVNPFPEGQEIMSKFQAMAVFFSYGTRLKTLHGLGENIPGSIPKIHFQTGLCTTRVSARRNMIQSCLRQNKALMLYGTIHKPEWLLTPTQWRTGTEILALLAISADVATLSQTEKKYVTALLVPLKMRMMRRYRRDVLRVIVLNEVTASPSMPHVMTNVTDMTRAGKNARDRAILEGERRFCGNTTEKITGDPVQFSDRDKIVVLVDCRTNNDTELLNDSSFRKECVRLLEDLYVGYGLRAMDFEAAQNATTTIEIEDEVPAVSTPDHMALARSACASLDTVWSDDEEDGDSVTDEPELDQVAIAQQLREASEAKLREEFDVSFKNYRKQSKKINWHSLSTTLDLGLDLPKPEERPIELMDLWDVDMGKVMKHVFINVDNSKALYGFLPQIATTSRGSIGAHIASGFPERINSCANLTLTKANSVMSPREINMLTVLRMNRDFMAYMRKKYPAVSRQHFQMTVVSDDMNEED